LATGGGAFMDPVTRALIARRAVSLWLRADLDVLVARVSRRSNRPLLKQGDPRAILAELIERRYPVYAEADVIVSSGGRSPGGAGGDRRRWRWRGALGRWAGGRSGRRRRRRRV